MLPSLSRPPHQVLGRPAVPRADLAFKAVGLKYEDYVRINDPEFMRPAEVDHLLADPSKAREELGWQPTVTFPELIQMMAESDLQNEAKAG
ncbi:MAG: GDP-mannose 4,6-dehydratase [Planctomycetes bacterium]|nr:GDP-mannose 4,6-dehydratase [Planctomycetota bacterium]